MAGVSDMFRLWMVTEYYVNNGVWKRYFMASVSLCNTGHRYSSQDII